MRMTLSKGATICATDPNVPVLVTDGRTLVGNMTIEYPPKTESLLLTFIRRVAYDPTSRYYHDARALLYDGGEQSPFKPTPIKENNNGTS